MNPVMGLTAFPPAVGRFESFVGQPPLHPPFVPTTTHAFIPGGGVHIIPRSTPPHTNNMYKAGQSNVNLGHVQQTVRQEDVQTGNNEYHGRRNAEKRQPKSFRKHVTVSERQRRQVHTHRLDPTENQNQSNSVGLAVEQGCNMATVDSHEPPSVPASGVSLTPRDGPSIAQEDWEVIHVDLVEQGCGTAAIDLYEAPFTSASVVAGAPHGGFSSAHAEYTASRVESSVPTAQEHSESLPAKSGSYGCLDSSSTTSVINQPNERVMRSDNQKTQNFLWVPSVTKAPPDIESLEAELCREKLVTRL